MDRPTGPDGVISKAIVSRREAARTREGWLRLGANVLVLVVVLWVLFSFVFFVHRVSGNDMYPATQDGDVLIGWRLGRDFKKGDLVVYEVDGTVRVGRIAALGGDVVNVESDGLVTVNGTPDSDALYETDGGSIISYPYLVPDGEVFILGDFRTQATDSRELGSVPSSDVEGAAIGLLRRRNL